MKQHFVKKCIICGSSKYEKLFFGEHCYKGKSFFLVRCLNCGLMYRNPQFDKESTRALYRDPNYFESKYKGGVERSYIESKKDYFREAKKTIKKIKKYKEKGKLLEIGCAGGYFLKVAKKMGYKVVGVEISEEMSDYARNSLGLKVITGVFEEIDFDKEKFDVIYGAHVLEHIPDPLDFLNKISKILRSFVPIPLTPFSTKIIIISNI